MCLGFWRPGVVGVCCWDGCFTRRIVLRPSANTLQWKSCPTKYTGRLEAISGKKSAPIVETSHCWEERIDFCLKCSTNWQWMMNKVWDNRKPGQGLGETNSDPSSTRFHSVSTQTPVHPYTHIWWDLLSVTFRDSPKISYLFSSSICEIIISLHHVCILWLPAICWPLYA